MTTLDEQYADVLNGDDDPDLARLVAELETLREGSPSQRGDMMIRHALAVRGRDLAQQGTRPTRVTGERQRQRILSGWRLLRSRLSVPLAALAIVLLSLGTYIHIQSPTPVSAQTVLHRAAAASPGPNEATHANYRVSSSDGSTGTADVWIGYDGSGAATQLAGQLSMSQGAQGPRLNAVLVAGGQRLLDLYHPTDSQSTLPPYPQGAQPSTTQGASRPGSDLISAAAQTMKGMVVGTLLAQKLSKEPTAYKLQQETLDGVSVYALQPAGAGNVTYYFNAQTYVLQGADWVQDGSTWQARLDGYSTVPLSAVPAHTFGSGTVGGQSSGEQGITRVVGPGSDSATQKP